MIKLELAQLFKEGTTRIYPNGQIIIYEGDPVNHLHHIESGYVKVFNYLDTGAERLIFIYGPGDLLPLITHLSRSQTVRYFYATMSEVKTRAITTEQLKRELKDNIDKGELLINYAHMINHQFFQRIEILSVNDARRKIIALLAFLVVKAGTDSMPTKLNVSLTQQDIANMSGLTREHASRQLTALKKEGLLLKSKGIVINTVKLNVLKDKLSIVI